MSMKDFFKCSSSWEPLGGSVASKKQQQQQQNKGLFVQISQKSFRWYKTASKPGL